MTGRRVAFWATYWTLTATIAVTASLAAALPFHGGTAIAIAAVTTGLIGLAALALAPDQRKEHHR